MEALTMLLILLACVGWADLSARRRARREHHAQALATALLRPDDPSLPPDPDSLDPRELDRWRDHATTLLASDGRRYR